MLENKQALIIGVNQYKSHPLHYCVDDACKLAELLETNEDGTKNFAVTLVDKPPTFAEMKSLLIEHFSQKADVLLFYFAGHGVVDGFGGHLVAPEGERHYWGVSMSDLFILANESKATNRIIILDCCYAANFGYPKQASGASAYLSEGITIMTSSRFDQRAYEKNGHGVFTNLLLDGLKGGAADLNGDVSPANLYAYIDKAMGKGQQRPVFKANISEFASLRNVNPPIAQDVLAQLTELFPDPDQPYQLDPSYEYTNDPSFKPLLYEPYAINENIAKLKALQKMQGVGLVVPVDAPYMYFAAMESRSCKLTPLGKHYWNLVDKNKEQV